MTWNRRVRVGEARLVRDAEERYGDAMRLHIEANELFAGVGDVGGAGYALSRASLSAYGTEDYEEALRLGRAGYEAFSEVNHRWGKIAALCRIGFAALALGDVGEAQRTFRDALERAHDSAAISLQLLALIGVGAVLRETGEREQAATMLTFALGHEQLPSSYSVVARPVLATLEAELPPEQLAAARLAADSTSLEDLLTQALEPSRSAARPPRELKGRTRSASWRKPSTRRGIVRRAPVTRLRADLSAVTRGLK